MTIKEICETIISYDDGSLSTTLDAAIVDGSALFRYVVGTDDYILFTNNASSIGIESITLDPDGDGEDILELAINNNNIHGLITMTGFLTDYEFLNNKVAEIQSGTDGSGDTYKYIRFDTASGFSITYVSGTHEGTLSSIWYQDMQRVIAHYSISIFVPMARRISANTSIYVTASYGDGNIIPTDVKGIREFSRTYKDNGNRILRNYYVTKHNTDNTETVEGNTL